MPLPTRSHHFSPRLELELLNSTILLRFLMWLLLKFSSVQSLRHVQLFATPLTAAHQASLSITNSRSLLKGMSIESVMPSNHLILCHPLLLPSIFPSIRVFSSESILCIRWSKYEVSASASVLPMNIQDWFPLGWTGWISLWSKGLSRVFYNTTISKALILRHSAFLVVQLSHPYMTTGKTESSTHLFKLTFKSKWLILYDFQKAGFDRR